MATAKENGKANKNEKEVKEMGKEVKEGKIKDEKVYTTKEMAASLGMTGKQLRRHLRGMEKYNDGIYTRYAWTKKDFDRIVKAIKAKLDGKKQDKQEAKQEAK